MERHKHPSPPVASLASVPDPRRPAAVEVLPAPGVPGIPQTSHGALGPAVGEFEAIFLHAPLAMILLDPSRRVCRLNRAASGLAGVSAEVGPGFLPGAFLCCAHLDESAGCGAGPRCDGCGLRRLIEQTFQTRQNATQVELDAPYFRSGRSEERRLRISSAYLTVRAEPRALLCIEDLSGQTRLPGRERPELGAPR